MHESDNNKRIPTVSRVTADTIIELVYDANKRETGLVVSRFGGLWNIEKEVRIETGETLIPYSPHNNLISNSCVLLPSVPVDFGDKGDLLREIEAFLRRYVDLSPLFERIAAHYVLMSWVYDAFGEVPYLRLRGDFGTGKTRALIAIGSLCYKPFFASGASTTSPIFHTLDAFGGTLLFDEADFRFSDATADIVKILNNGNVRGLPVLRTMVNRYKEFNPRAFKVFGPKIIAMRGAYEDKALESRFLTEEMGLRELRPDIPINLPASLHNEALALRNRLLHYRLCNFFTIKTDPSVVSRDLEPRLNQTALSLLSIVDDEGLRREIAASLAVRHDEIRQDRRETVEASLVEAVLQAFNLSTGPSVSIGEIRVQFNTLARSEYGQAFSNKWVGTAIRTKLRLTTQKSHGVYVVPISERPKIDALAARYGILQKSLSPEPKSPEPNKRYD